MEYIKGLVSVVIPTYRRQTTLKRAIDSVLGQTYSNVEIIVVNDNTPNDEFSLELYDLMKHYEDKENVFLIEQERHINGAAARNVGIHKAKGEYICFLDDDDYYTEEKLINQVMVLENLDKEYGMVSCLCRMNNNGKLHFAQLPYKDGNVLIPVLSRKIGLGTGAVLIRRTALDDAGYFDENLKRHQDLQLFAGICSKYKIKLIKKYYHNIDISDGQNRPDLQRLIEIKNAYYESIKNILDNLSKNEKALVFKANDLEIASAYRKEGKYFKCIKTLLGICVSPKAIGVGLSRAISKFVGTKFAKNLIKKYEV